MALPGDGELVAVAVEGLPEVERGTEHTYDCIWQTTVVPVVFLVLPITVLFALFPGFYGFTLTTV